MQIYPQIAQTMEPEGLRNFNKHVFFPKFLQDPALIDIMLPDTLDEIKAEQENERLAANDLPEVHPQDQHQTHIYTHQMVSPKTLATWFHIAEHEEMLAEQREQGIIVPQEERLLQQQQVGNPQSAENRPEFGVERTNPKQQTASLKSETQQSGKEINNKSRR